MLWFGIYQKKRIELKNQLGIKQDERTITKTTSYHSKRKGARQASSTSLSMVDPSTNAVGQIMAIRSMGIA